MGFAALRWSDLVFYYILQKFRTNRVTGLEIVRGEQNFTHK